jgi:hypothetical protein
METEQLQGGSFLDQEQLNVRADSFLSYDHHDDIVFGLVSGMATYPRA